MSSVQPMRADKPTTRRRKVAARTVAARLRLVDRVGASLGMELLEIRAGSATVQMIVRADMLNGHSIAHGGMVFALADTALAYASNSRNAATVTQHASITYLSPARAGDRMIARASERSVAGRSGVYDVEVKTHDGRTLAILNGLTRVTRECIVQ